MQVRNSNIGKFVVSSETSPKVPSLNELSQLNFKHQTAKTSFSARDWPEILVEKQVIMNPPMTEFKVQDYPLKRMNRGISGWDWQTETSEEYELTDRVKNCKPTYSTFQKLFPSRNQNLFKEKKKFSLETSPVPQKEFNKKLDRLSEYRESMLRAQQLFKIQ